MKPSEVIMERGWIQGNGENSRGVCAMTAAYVACHGHNRTTDCSKRCERITVAVDSIHRSFTGYNDTEGRTIEQVIALLQEFETEFESEEIAQAEPVAIAHTL